MPAKHFRIALLLLPLLCGVAEISAQQPPPPPRQPQAGGVVASEPRFRPLRAVSGTKGSVQGGRYIIEDPRTVFYVPEDKQVIVYFEWEGPPGMHHFEGLWKNPEGKVTVISDFSYEAKDKRFGGYWTLVLSETVPTGLWTLEARVDEEMAGTHPFQVLAAARPESDKTPPVRAPLAQAEIYKQAVAASVWIDALDDLGEEFNVGSGFFLGEGIVTTTFQTIDGAHSLRIRRADGKPVALESVLGWNRWQDWAVLKVNEGGNPKLKRAASAPSVGDRVFALDSPSAGSRTMIPMDIIGKNSFDRAGERFNVTNTVTARGSGSPLLDEYGDVVGVMGTSIIPGVGSLTSSRFGYIQIGLGTVIQGGLALPISAISMQGSRASTLADLHQAKVMIAPLRKKGQMYGGLSRVAEKGSVLSADVQSTGEFKRSDKQCVASLHMRPSEKGKALVTLRIFDAENQRLGEAKPMKTNLKPGEWQTAEWKFSIETLRPGIYRLDIYFDADPVWRTFFRIVE